MQHSDASVFTAESLGVTTRANGVRDVPPLPAETEAQRDALARERVERAGIVWAPEVRGSLCHQLIAELCDRAITDPHEIEPLARSVLPPRLAVVRRQALLSFLVPMAGSYLRHFARPDWRFMGSEIIVGSVALDLLWQRGERLEADEVKSCASGAEGWLPAAEAQAREQALACRVHFGSRFAGVRVVALAIPSTSVWVPA